MNRKFKALAYATQLISDCLSFHTRSTYRVQFKAYHKHNWKIQCKISKQETKAKQ